MLQYLRIQNVTTAFYIAQFDDEPHDLTSVKIIFTTKHEQMIAVNNVSLVISDLGSTARVIEDYNLNGMLARSVSLNWLPFLLLEDCEPDVSAIEQCQIIFH